MLIEAYTYKPAQNVTLTEGQSATFTCTVYPEIWRSGQVHAYYAKYDKYICKDPCGPHDWHLVMAATDETLAPNRNPRFTMTKIPHSNGAQITISDVKFASTYVHVNINDHQDSTSFHIPDPHHYPSSDLDSDDDIL